MAASRHELVLVPTQPILRESPDGGPATPVFALNRAYVRALEEAGLSPLLLAPGTDPAAVIDLVTGVLLPGGPDLEPRHYGAEPDPTTESVPESDELELEVVSLALRRKLPLLAICRGLQLLNVALGGSLHQDLPQHPRQVDSGGHRLARDRVVHTIRVDPHSRLHEIVGSERLDVNSLHHQGVDRLAPQLRASAWAEDGLVEGAEIESYGFCVAVQYHPEELSPLDHRARALFEAFARACRERHISPQAGTGDRTPDLAGAPRA